MNKSTNSGTNLAWFSYVPYWSSVSTIFSMEMMPSLAKIYDVTVWTLQSEWRSFSNTTNEFKIRQLVSGNDLWLELNQSQVFVYCAFDLPFESNDFLIATAQGYPGLLIVNRKIPRVNINPIYAWGFRMGNTRQTYYPHYSWICSFFARTFAKRQGAVHLGSGRRTTASQPL